MIKSNYRLLSLLLGIVTLTILITSFYFEYVRGLNPCPLCLMQRLCVMLLLFCISIGFYFNRVTAARKITFAQIIIAWAGVFFAARQLWLQSLPVDQLPICMPGLSMMIHYLPWQQVVSALFLGAGDCAEVSWTWLGLSMPAWSMFYFLGMLLASFASYMHLRKANYLLKKSPYL